MLRYFLSLLALSSALAFPLAADTFHKGVKPELRHVIATALYSGDKQGDFVGDLVAILDDGSRWKIHPTRTDKYMAWDQDDVIHVGIREKFYWFTREHKFQLVNHTKNETIKVMMVKLPEEFLQIVSSKVYVDSYHYETKTTKDANGKSRTTSEIKYIYAKKIALSDGTSWKVCPDLKGFNKGDAVYIGTHMKKKTGSYFIVGRIEKNAVASWAVKFL